MSKLYFINCYNEKRLVKENVLIEETISAIKEYVKSLNPNYKIYYVRSWATENGNTMYDVGSHTEFFELEEDD
jgi:spermidine/putrescine-binding protein